MDRQRRGLPVNRAVRIRRSVFRSRPLAAGLLALLAISSVHLAAASRYVVYLPLTSQLNPGFGPTPRPGTTTLPNPTPKPGATSVPGATPRPGTSPTPNPDPRPNPTATASPPSGPAYYVDCNDGNDSNDGRVPERAWRSIQRANQAELRPGDNLLLKHGCSWTGPLMLRWSGTAGQPIRVGGYGSGARPLIQNAQDNVVVSGSHLMIEQLAVRGMPSRADAGCGNQPVGWAIGFRLEAGATYNLLRDVEARGLTHGIKIFNGAHHNRVLNSSFVDNTLMFLLDRADTGNDSGAVGIVLDGDDNEIAYNTFNGHDACSYDFGRDGAAVEVYGGQRNRIHHNTAANNNAFSELGNPRSADNVYAYNLVLADIAAAQFLVTRGAQSRWGPVYGTQVYNNSVYLRHPTSFGVNCDSSCDSRVLTLKNNIIWSEGIVGYIDTRSDEGHNLFWKADGQPKVWFPNPQDMNSTSRIADPRFVNAAQNNLELRGDSPAVNTGTAEVLNLGHTTDLKNSVVPQQQSVDIGAYEYVPLIEKIETN